MRLLRCQQADARAQEGDVTMKRGPYVSCLPDCEFNKYVGCADCMTCDKCGWNPEVEQRRKNKLKGIEKEIGRNEFSEMNKMLGL